jgi:hypothetical protein
MDTGKLVVYGPLCDPEIRRVVLGADYNRVQYEDGLIFGKIEQAAESLDGACDAVLVRSANRLAKVGVLSHLTDEALRRIQHYLGDSFRMERIPVMMEDQK